MSSSVAPLKPLRIDHFNCFSPNVDESVAFYNELGFRVTVNTDNRLMSGCSMSSEMTALSEAFGHRSYVLLVFGFFTCGFQLAFITLHLPAYLIDRGLSAQVGGWALATIGLFNIIGSISVGWRHQGRSSTAIP